MSTAIVIIVVIIVISLAVLVLIFVIHYVVLILVDFLVAAERGLRLVLQALMRRLRFLERFGTAGKRRRRQVAPLAPFAAELEQGVMP